MGCVGREITMTDHKNRAADWLSLAAAPSFAVMALLTAVFGGGRMAAMCGATPLSGMVPMYLLMSAFHVGPWLKRIAGRREGDTAHH
jgi:hypothetical protein